MELSPTPEQETQPALAHGDAGGSTRATSGLSIILQVLGLLLILALGAYFRFTGLTWGDYSYPHPDERFLIWVVADIAPVDNPGAYFDTANSSLNPANRGHAFFVYGDLPVVATRYVTEWVFNQAGWEEILQTGRGLSAILDLFTVLFVYLIARRLSGWKVATLAGFFFAAAVLPIQQAHFFTSDSFSVCFTTLTIYLGVLIATQRGHGTSGHIWTLSALYGLAVGLAMACKINTAPVAVLLPAALFVRYLRAHPHDRDRWIAPLLGCAVLGGAVALLVFRLTMPYAFSGPGFFNVSIDQRWLASMKELSAQSSGDVDFPPALQWARRSHLFSLENLVLWGLGIPLGLMSWAGFFILAWRVLGIFRRGQPMRLLEGTWPGALLVWAWTAFYFTWQSMAWNPTMRYQLPIYPTLAVLAAWGLGSLWHERLAFSRARQPRLAPAAQEVAPQEVAAAESLAAPEPTAWNEYAYEAPAVSARPVSKPAAARTEAVVSPGPRWRTLIAILGGLVLLLTLAWAFAFTRIYNRTETRVAASEWIFANLPGPVNAAIDPSDAAPVSGATEGSGVAEGNGVLEQRLSIREAATFELGRPYLTEFENEQAGVLTKVSLPKTTIIVGATNPADLRLRVRIYEPANGDQTLAQAEIPLPVSGSLDNLDIPSNGLGRLEAKHRYRLAIEVVPASAAAGQPAQPAAGESVVVNLEGQLSLSLSGRARSEVYQVAGGGFSPLRLEDGGTLRQIRLPAGSTLNAALVMVEDPQNNKIETANANAAAPAVGIAPAAGEQILTLDNPIEVQPGVNYMVAVSSAVPGQTAALPLPIQIDFLDQPATQLMPALGPVARFDSPIWVVLNPQKTGTLRQVTLPHVLQTDPSVSGPTSLTLQIFPGSTNNGPMAQTTLQGDFSAKDDVRGGALTFTFDPPVQLRENVPYSVSITPNQGAVTVHGTSVANESTWDMGLPFRLGNYDPFGGIYRSDLNFEMYWDDNADKYQRFVNTLDQADYLFFSSNRQWGTTTRIPERYPLTTEFYRRLLGCPADKDVVWCYRVAEPGKFQGDLGYDLVKTVTSYPNLGPLRINTQFAEEAFTVYDAPKVMIFQKRADYDPQRVRAILGQVDLNRVTHVSPRKAAGFKDLLLPAVMWAKQQAGGTWAGLFPPGGLLNQSEWLATVVWYLFLFLLGLLVYPIVRLALRGLPDRGYPLARISGLVILGYLAWISGSAQIPVTRGLLAGIFVLIALLGLGLGYLQRDELREEWRTRRKYLLTVETVALVLFGIELLIRLGNPDLWHPIYGGEKPMDFSFFNAVLKSTVFPPYDPWFASGYINYYYYGFVLVGMPVKLLGITPSVAYNLILPALFSMVGLGAFSAGWNIFLAARPRKVLESSDAVPEKLAPQEVAMAEQEAAVAQIYGAPETPKAAAVAASADASAFTETPASPASSLARGALYAGITAVLALLILGNLGTVRMYWQGLQKLVVSDEVMNNGNFGEHIAWAGQGLSKILSHQADSLPYYSGDWYWKPSRAIEPEDGNEITEFPFFTFIYADLHAHLMALPVTLLVLGWALSMIFGRGQWGLPGPDGTRRWRRLALLVALLLGALAAGALRPANTWDQYTYLTLAALALAYSQWRAEPGWGPFRQRWLNVILPVLLLVGLAVLFYHPFDAWFAQGYNSLDVWKGNKTNLNSYLVHWGLFLFVITTWLFQETVDWMAETPVSALNRLRPYRLAIIGILLATVALIGVLLYQKVQISVIAVPLGIWATLLLIRPGQPDAKRVVLFMIGTALVLTLAVELVAVHGDIGRMNTVFKFYYQAWTLLSISAAAGLLWLWDRLLHWKMSLQSVWMVALTLLFIGAGLFPITATRAKVEDRMMENAPHSLDGMAYMSVAKYTDGNNDTNGPTAEMDLSQDYRAIKWAQANTPGSPVIVEANTPEYRHWGTRFTIYTGLPGVVGWNWHERQQRTVTPDTWVFDRISDVEAFYQTPSMEQARAFLKKYNVQYIIVGQLERLWYSSDGIAKFDAFNHVLWEPVYQEGQTVIYKVK